MKSKLALENNLHSYTLKASYKETMMLRFKKTIDSETRKTSQPMKLLKILINLGRAEEDCYFTAVFLKLSNSIIQVEKFYAWKQNVKPSLFNSKWIIQMKHGYDLCKKLKLKCFCSDFWKKIRIEYDRSVTFFQTILKPNDTRLGLIPWSYWSSKGRAYQYTKRSMKMLRTESN